MSELFDLYSALYPVVVMLMILHNCFFIDLVSYYRCWCSKWFTWFCDFERFRFEIIQELIVFRIILKIVQGKLLGV